MPKSELSSDQERPKWRWLWTVLSIGAFLAVLTFLWSVEDEADVETRVAQPLPPVVSVIEVGRSDAQATISVFAELKPRWDAQIRAAVSGSIDEVFDAALSGNRVTAGTPLFAIQRVQYETAVAEAEAALEQARLTHLRTENDAAIAKRQLQRASVEAPTELALKLPQLRIAARNLSAAETRLEAARRQLADTEVVAPFSGFVTERMASLGQMVTAGEALLHLSDDQHFELVASLSQAEWSMLQQPVAGAAVKLYHRNGNELGTGRVRQGGGFLDPDTRQVNVFIDVSEAEATVLSGDFLQVRFAGRILENTLTLPDGALTRSGQVWFVGNDDTLERHQPQVLFRSDNAITIASPKGAGPWRVAKTPLASFLPGQRVTPQATEG